ncbi:Cytochrome c oxidase subunit 4, mitochondrial [Smittium mucronatum]|uniref:Cytochrome c oxidase subunit 4, mitochondrial n=1 Tax=Smittium mucronatum TaxID=133383 RepID=A0A1R0H155_9FUNG|nr:Cytochrome c oxidase subunit 4, mitochondrial [Smittium mucronatum]
MFKSILSTRQAVFRAIQKPISTRSFCISAKLSSDHPPTEIIQGPGAPLSKVPTDYEQATGLDRLERLAALKGEKFFDEEPLFLTKKGTRAEPTIVPSGAPWRLVGCQGAPGEEHELLYLKIERDHDIDRCPECGNVYKLSD